MEIPFYYSFKEFEENYKNDLENWLKKLPNAIENDFKNESIKKYNLFYDYGSFLNTVKMTNTYDKHSDVREFLPYFGFVITNRLQILFEKEDYKTESDYIFLMNDIYRVCGYNQEKERGDKYFIDAVTYKIYIKFFKVVFDESLRKYSLELDKEKFKDFEFASREIRKFLNNEIKTEAIIKNTQEDTDEKTQNKFSVPQIIKILDKLNIKGYMQEKGFTDFQTVQLLADIFERSEKTIRNNFDNKNHITTAENYISDLKKLTAKR
jgi:hypothetical protein